MGPIWGLSVPDGPHVVPNNQAIKGGAHVHWKPETVLKSHGIA